MGALEAAATGDGPCQNDALPRLHVVNAGTHLEHHSCTLVTHDVRAADGPERVVVRVAYACRLNGHPDLTVPGPADRHVLDAERPLAVSNRCAHLHT